MAFDALARFFGRLAGQAPGLDKMVDKVDRRLEELSDAQRDQAARLESALAALRPGKGQAATSKDASEILQALRALTRDLDRADARIYAQLDEIAKGTAPIVIGPWTGEVGFELLYWAPFVRWFQARWKIPGERCVIVSRGGTASWYGIEGARYVDAFDVMSVDAFRAGTDPDKHKQRKVSAFDQEIVAAAAGRLSLTTPGTLHPEVMYRALSPFWTDEAGFAAVERFTLHRRLASPDDPLDEPLLAALPREYVAARFYFSDAFPDTPQNRSTARAVLASVSRTLPVVLLDPGLRVDDHADYSSADPGRIIALPPGIAPERNLAVQSVIISRARAFVGTYGGYAYLAPLYGVPAIGIYSSRNFKSHHLYAAQRVFERLGAGALHAVDAGDLDLLATLVRSVRL